MKLCPKCNGRKQYYSSGKGSCSFSANGAPLVNCEACLGVGYLPPNKADYGLLEEGNTNPQGTPKKRRGRPKKSSQEDNV